MGTALEILREAAPTLSVGMVTADLLSLGSEMQLLHDSGVKVVHFDVMDGVFCPMTTIGPPIVKAVKTPLLKDVHLMIDEPLEKVDAYVAAGADIVTVHAESTIHIHRVLQHLGKQENVNDAERGLMRGVALNPGTPISALEPLMGELELILILAVNPGWGGQGFAPEAPSRLAQAKDLIERSGRDIALGVDGGITKSNLAEVVRLGPDLIVTGSAVFDGKTPAKNAHEMLEVVANATA